MKRFFCTVCNKIKRVRVLPTNVERIIDKDGNLKVRESVALRKGTCRWH